jgi:F0F1-type ATP synthase assembly protein I
MNPLCILAISSAFISALILGMILGLLLATYGGHR